MAGVIETLFYMFDADASKLDAGLNKSRKSNKELEHELDQTDATAQKLGASFVNMAKQAGGAIVAAFAVGAIKNTILQTADYVDQLNDVAEALAVNVTELEAYDAAAKMTGGQNGAFIQSLKGLNEGITTIATKGKGLMLPFFAELGLNLADIKRLSGDPIQAIRELSDTFGELSEAEAAAIGSKIGLDQGTINLLRQGRQGLDDIVKRQRELGEVTEQDAAAAAKFNDELDEVGRVWEGLKRKAVTGILPALTWFMDKVKIVVDYLSKHKTAVAGFFTTVAAVITAYYLPSIIRAVIATYALIAPYVLLAAAVIGVGVAAGLALEDVDKFLRGQDSAIGELAKKYPKIGEAVKDSAIIFAWWGELQTGMLKALTDLIEHGPRVAFENLDKTVKTIIASITARFPLIGNVMRIFQGVASQVVSGLLSLFAKLGDFIGGVTDRIVTLIKMAAQAANTVGGILGLEMPKFSGNDTRTTAQRRADAAAVLTGSTNTLAGRTAAAKAAEPASVATSAARASQAAAAGQKLIQAANASPYTKPTESVRPAAGGQKVTNVTVEKVEVNTQATDADGISRAMAQSLSTQVNRAIDQNDDGIIA